MSFVRLATVVLLAPLTLTVGIPESVAQERVTLIAQAEPDFTPPPPPSPPAEPAEPFVEFEEEGDFLDPLRYLFFLPGMIFPLASFVVALLVLLTLRRLTRAIEAIQVNLARLSSPPPPSERPSTDAE